MPVVGSIFNSASAVVPKTRRAHARPDIHYVAGLMSLEQMSRQLRDEAQAVDRANADGLLVLTDGSAGLEVCALNAVPVISRETVLILDFHHAHDHLLESAKGYYIETAEQSTLVSQWSLLLKEHGVQALIKTLSSRDLTDPSEAAPQATANCVGLPQ